MHTELEVLKNTDIYLIDLILKGKLDHVQSVLDVGCGKGRNLEYFIQKGVDVFGVDPDMERLQVAQDKAPLQKDHFKTGVAENIPFERQFDLVIANAVLHFANDEEHFEKMLSGLWSKVRPSGLLFIRTASDIGIEDRIKDVGNGRYELPDESTRYLVTRSMLTKFTNKLNASLVEQIKTTNVNDLRSMTTWILSK